jgi:hypothetical protein
MADAVADYGLRLELSRVLLQLREVQLRALDEPVYRALVSASSLSRASGRTHRRRCHLPRDAPLRCALRRNLAP